MLPVLLGADNCSKTPDANDVRPKPQADPEPTCAREAHLTAIARYLLRARFACGDVGITYTLVTKDKTGRCINRPHYPGAFSVSPADFIVPGPPEGCSDSSLSITVTPHGQIMSHSCEIIRNGTTVSKVYEVSSNIIFCNPGKYKV